MERVTGALAPSGAFVDNILRSLSALYLTEIADIHWVSMGALCLFGYMSMCVILFVRSSASGQHRGSQLNYTSTGITKRASDILTPADEKYVEKSKKILVDTEKEVIVGDESGYAEGAKYISTLLKSKIIDVGGLMRENAHELFLMHRETGPLLEGGVGVRVTVQVLLKDTILFC